MKSAKQRFYEKVSLPDEHGCMLWAKGTNGKGYGTFYFRGDKVYAHRFAYELMAGPIPEGFEIDHVRARGCRSTLCVTPDHLEAVTHDENIARRRLPKYSDAVVAANRERAARITHCPRGHEYTPENMHKGRDCRRCRRDRNKRRKEA